MDWENISWVFSGIGSTVISIIVGAICGGVAGYRIGIKKMTIKQTQKRMRNALVWNDDITVKLLFFANLVIT